MASLDLSGNSDLDGTLPNSFSFWPELMALFLLNTSLHGTLPSQLCNPTGNLHHV